MANTISSDRIGAHNLSGLKMRKSKQSVDHDSNAIQLLRGSLSQRQVANRLGCSASSVHRWRKILDNQKSPSGTLNPKRSSCRKLSAKQQLQLIELLQRQKCGPKHPRLTSRRIANLIRGAFGVTYHPRYIPELLRRLELLPSTGVAGVTWRKCFRSRALPRRQLVLCLRLLANIKVSPDQDSIHRCPWIPEDLAAVRKARQAFLTDGNHLER